MEIKPLIVGFILGIILSCAVIYLQSSIPNSNIPDEVKTYLKNFRMYVKETNTWSTFEITGPLIRVIFYKQGGYILSMDTWVECQWQIVIGAEDKPFEDNGHVTGDSADVILKLRKLSTGQVTFEIACLGCYTKYIYYGAKLLINSATTRYVSGTL